MEKSTLFVISWRVWVLKSYSSGLIMKLKVLKLRKRLKSFMVSCQFPRGDDIFLKGKIFAESEDKNNEIYNISQFLDSKFNFWDCLPDFRILTFANLQAQTLVSSECNFDQTDRIFRGFISEIMPPT